MSYCKYCGELIDWIKPPGGRPVPVEYRPAVVMPGRGTEEFITHGLRRVSTLFGQKRIRVHRRCAGLVNELGSYVWDSKAALAGSEKPVKSMDHGPDALRYFVNTCMPAWRYGEEG